MKKLQHYSLNVPNELLKDFYNNSLCLNASEYLPEDNYYELLMGLLNCIVEIPCNKILSILKENFKPALITKANIPQFSSFEDCYTGVSRGILESGLEWVDFNKVGYLLRVAPRKEGADKKYGENHSKIASMLGLVIIERGKGVGLTDFGRYHLSLNDIQRKNLMGKLSLRIPLIMNYFCQNEDESVVTDCRSLLSESTYKRRLSNIRKLIGIVRNQLNEELYGTTY